MKVLLIEDEASSATIVRLLLNGWSVFVAPTLSDGLAALRSGVLFDIILADLKLPDSPPHETIARIMKNAGSAPVVAVTGMHLTDELINTADAAIEKTEFQTGETMRAWLLDIISQKKKESRVMTEAKRIAAWLSWKSKEQAKP